jgi:hypothetical protein
MGVATGRKFTRGTREAEVVWQARTGARALYY